MSKPIEGGTYSYSIWCINFRVSTNTFVKQVNLIGYAVKELIGGIEYWEKEGYPVEIS